MRYLLYYTCKCVAWGERGAMGIPCNSERGLTDHTWDSDKGILK